MAGPTTGTTPNTIDAVLDFRQTSRHVKEERKMEWRDLLTKVRTEINSDESSLSLGLMRVAIKLMEELSSRQHPGDAARAAFHAYKDLGLSGGYADLIAGQVSYYHPRGEEFYAYWKRAGRRGNFDVR